MASNTIKQQRKRLQETDWNVLYPKALLWAKTWHRRYLSGIPSPWEPEDLVQGAIDSLYEGRRMLPQNVSVLTGIIHIMQSMATNLDKKKERQRVTYEESKDEGTAMDGLAWLCNDVLRIVKGDELVERIVALLCQDPEYKPSDLAAQLGIEVKEIYNAVKRMKRKASQLLNRAG